MTDRLPLVQVEDRPGILDLSWGQPAPSALPVREWRSAAQAALDEYGWQALAYGHEPGPGPLLDWLAERLTRTDHGVTPVSQFFVTAGASHALELVSCVLTKPGDLVVVDSPTYHLALGILADRGVQLVGAPADADGLDPAATADLIAEAQRAGRRVPLLYIVPTFSNPTGRSLADDRRRALVELARQARLTIVEDDTYRELVYRPPAPPSLWSVAGGGPVVRIGSFAKTVAPGLRLGWINAEPDLIGTLSRWGYVHSGGGVNHTTALTMAAFGSSGAYQAHLDQVRIRYAGQRDALVAALRTELPGVDVPTAAGGWFTWLELPPPVDTAALLPAAERLGVAYLPGSLFYAGTGGRQQLRLSFSLLSELELAEAAGRLATAVRSFHAGS